VNDESDKQKLAYAGSEKRVKNDQKTGVQKGSKMAKNEGPKKGQKWPKNGLFPTLKKWRTESKNNNNNKSDKLTQRWSHIKHMTSQKQKQLIKISQKKKKRPKNGCTERSQKRHKPSKKTTYIKY
jgi:hypothetical protein